MKGSYNRGGPTSAGFEYGGYRPRSEIIPTTEPPKNPNLPKGVNFTDALQWLFAGYKITNPDLSKANKWLEGEVVNNVFRFNIVCRVNKDFTSTEVGMGIPIDFITRTDWTLSVNMD